MEKIKTLWKDQHNEIRTFWWLALFLGLVALSRPIFSFVNSSLKDLQVNEHLLTPLPFAFILIISWCCLKLRNENLPHIGLQLDTLWWRQLALGLLISFIQIATVVLIVWLVGGVTFTSNSNFHIEILLIGFYTMIFGVLMEELLFRGFIFQRMIHGIGFWPTQFLFAAVFSFGHFTDPELALTAQILGGLDLVIFALVMGVAYQKTKSLALPVGLHLGWNWMQGHIFGFAVSGHDKEGILIASLESMPIWVNGGSFGAEASIFGVLSELFVLFALMKWKGSINTLKAGETSRKELNSARNQKHLA